MTRLAIGIDGGGTGTRLLMANARGEVVARAAGGPSALGLGVDRAWSAIAQTVSDAFDSAGLAFDWSACTVCAGLSGVNNAAWREAFEAATPPGASLMLVSDAYTTLWGAHKGAPGVIVALGTGSIAAALVATPAGVLEERIAGGYGFPSGDEASGAWLGLRAIVYLQQVMDGRREADAFSEALRKHTGATTRDELVGWCCDANQTIYATLAPIVIAFGTQATPNAFADELLQQAGEQIAKMIDALDPASALPVALCGGLAQPLAAFVPARFGPRLHEPATDSVGGALALATARLAASSVV